MALVQRLRDGLPEAAAATDDWLSRRSWLASGHAGVWLEAFTDRSSEAIRRRDAAALTAQTRFIAAEYLHGPEPVRALIASAYAENLMWDLDALDRVWAWPHIDATLQALYALRWGAPQDVGSVCGAGSPG